MKKLIIPFLMLLLILISCGKKNTQFVYDENKTMTLSHHDENYVVSNNDKEEIINLLNDMEFVANDKYDGYAGWVYCIKYDDYSILLTSYATYSKDNVSYVASNEEVYEKLYTIIKNLYIELNGEDVK